MLRAASIPPISDYEGRPESDRPRVSIITTVRNGEKTLARTIDSVRAQQFPGLEYIIVDAGSRDGTLDIVRANADIVTFWKSEPDRGISDGFNKGIAMAQGEYVTLINADDWLSPGQIAFGIETLEKSGADFVFGDLIYHDDAGAAIHRITGDADYLRRIGHIMPALNHPTVVVRRDVYERCGLFDLNLGMAMDYELLLRFHREGCRGIYDARIVGHMSLGGVSDARSHAALAEVRDISIRHGGSPLAAWSRFFFRIVKGDVRHLLERTLPASLFQRLRARANGNISRSAQ